MEKIKLAFIGCGRIIDKHIEALINNKDFYYPVTCVDLNKNNAINTASKMKELNKNITIYTDYREMLQKEKIDTVVIATDSGSHFKIGYDCINENKNIILEKPIALSTKDCEELIKIKNKKKVKAIVCYQNRFNQPIQKLKKAIESNNFGKIYHSQISIRWNRNIDYYNQALWRNTWEYDGGTLMNQCSHSIDLLQWIIGEKPISLYGILRKYSSPREAEDFGTAIIEFDKGIVGIIEASMNIYPKNLENRLSIFGEKGTVIIGGLSVNYIENWIFKDEVIKEERNDPPDVYGFGHSAIYKDFYESIYYNRDPYITLEEGKKSVDIILGIYKSMKENKKIKFPVNYSTIKMKNLNLKKIS